jgi:hypothetical protein
MLAGVRVVSSISISSMSLKRELVLDAASRKNNSQDVSKSVSS